jgi:glycosyltransferase involved in cell wall biosynthesis
VFGVHGLINRRHKVSHFSVCGNGWDAAETIDLSEDDGNSTKPDWPSEEKLKSSWLFIGRGNDKVKGAARLAPLSKDLNLIAVPGEGFELLPWVHKTGALSSKNVQRLLLQAKGLVLTSYYEGLPLVVLEALGHGVPVITTAVGGLKSLDKNLKGLYFTDHKLKSLLKIASAVTPYDRASVALHNRKFLRTWSNVTDVIYNKAIGKL